jgi:hypothetical protein
VLQTSDIAKLELQKLNGKPLRVQLTALFAITLILMDIGIETAKGYIMIRLREHYNVFQESEVEQALRNQRIIDNISFSATLVATFLSVYQDVDETVIALIKGEYYKQIQEILSKLVM